jgi:hypothetical protein
MIQITGNPDPILPVKSINDPGKDKQRKSCPKVAGCTSILVNIMRLLGKID